MDGWQDIESAPEELSRCLLWVSTETWDRERRVKAPYGIVIGRFMFGEPYGEGMGGDWDYTHWMPLPPAPTPSSTATNNKDESDG